MRPKKYPEGFMHLDFLMPISIIQKLEDFCAKYNLSKTDTILMAINFIVVPKEERERQLRDAIILNETLTRDNAKLHNEIGALRTALDDARIRKVQHQIPNCEAAKFLQQTKDMLAAGTLSKKGLETRLGMLREFAAIRTLPDSQRDSILIFLDQAETVLLNAEHQNDTRIQRAQNNLGKGLKRPKSDIMPSIYDFTKTDWPEPDTKKSRRDLIYEKLMELD